MTQQQINRRNWQKARLTGMGVDESCLTTEERMVYIRILAARTQLLESWDENTASLIGHPLKPYKCCTCSRRSNVQRIHPENGRNYCFKHYKAFT